MPHHGGLEEGQKVHVQRAVLVGEGDGHRRTGEHRADVHPAVLQQGSAEGDAVGGVVVAADGEHRQLPLSQLGEEPVQQAHGLGRGNGLIVEVARQQHTVHGRAVQQGEDLFQNVPLVVQHGELAHPLAQMQVGKMQKTQTETPPFQSFLYYTAGRGWGQGKQKRENPLSQCFALSALPKGGLLCIRRQSAEAALENAADGYGPNCEKVDRKQPPLFPIHK